MNSDPVRTNHEMLDLAGLSALLRLKPATLLTKRTRAPNQVPPPWCTRPLRWQRQSVIDWLRRQEHEEQRRIDERCRVVSTCRTPRSPKR